MPKGKIWTQDDIDSLARLREEGLTLHEIADRLGRSFRSVAHKCYVYPDCGIKGSWRSLDEEQLRWLDEHYGNTSNHDLREHLRLSHASLHILARERGLVKTPEYMQAAQLAATKAAKRSHIRNGTFPRKGYVIPRSEEFWFRPGKGRGVWERVSDEKAKEMKRKARENWRKLYDSDKRRTLAWGFEPRTKFRFVRQPTPKISYRYGLRKLGYIEDAEDHNLYYYTDKTIRRERRESHASRHHIRIQPLPDGYEETD